MASRIRPRCDVVFPGTRGRDYPCAMDLPVQATLIGRIALGAFLGFVIGFEERPPADD